MAELLATGAATGGQLALLIGYGAGLSYAAQVVRLPNG
jgi:beta-ketoacyl ACP synthase